MILVPLFNPKFAIGFAARCARTSGSGALAAPKPTSCMIASKVRLRNGRTRDRRCAPTVFSALLPYGNVAGTRTAAQPDRGTLLASSGTCASVAQWTAPAAGTIRTRRSARVTFAPWSDPGARPLLRFDGVSKRFSGVAAVEARVARHLPRRILRAARAFRLRQDHAAAPARRLRDAGRGPHLARRRGHRAGAAASAAGQHDVPELCAVSTPHGRRQRRVRAQAGGAAHERDRGARRGHAGAGQARRLRQTQAAPAFRRPAPARRARALAGRSVRASCCSTSRSRRSTRSCAGRRSSS